MEAKFRIQFAALLLVVLSVLADTRPPQAQAQNPSRPNILFAIADDWSFGPAGAYGTTCHRGYEYGSGVAKGGKRLSDIDRVPSYWPDNAIVRNDRLDYAFEVEHFDRHLGRMLETLEKAGALDNTIVIGTSDHGMPFPSAYF